jgi:hypothetical protein
MYRHSLFGSGLAGLGISSQGKKWRQFDDPKMMKIVPLEKLPYRRHFFF